MTISPTVLIVDDDPVSRALVKRALAAEHYTVLVATRGREARELYFQHRPSLVVTDWMMPDLCGPDLCRQIREQSRDSYTYVILLTGMAQKQKIVQGLDAGADDYLIKPFHPDELVARIRVGQRQVELHRELAEKNRWLQQLSLTDALTDLPNRRALEQWAARELHRAVRHGCPLWIVLADLDHFKSVNDTYGHDAGDAVLKAFARLMTANCRQSDFVGRYGGEEFLLLLTHADPQQARLAVERIREQAAAHPLNWNGRLIPFTASFGLAGWAAGADPDFPRLLADADAALYSAKRNGRNRVEMAVVHTDPAEPAAPEQSPARVEVREFP